MTGRIARAALRAAVILWIPAAIAWAGDGTIPVLSASDGSKAWVEISRSGNRTTARPALAVPGETVPRRTPPDGNGKQRIVALPGGKAEARTHQDVGDLLRRQKSRLVRERPEGISLGGALGLAGEVREALKDGKDGGEKLDAVVRILNEPVVEWDSLSEVYVPEESAPSSAPVEPAVSSAVSVRH